MIEFFIGKNRTTGEYDILLRDGEVVKVVQTNIKTREKAFKAVEIWMEFEEYRTK